MKKLSVLILVAAAASASAAHPRAQEADAQHGTATSPAPAPSPAPTLKPTAHPRLPADPSQLWLAPDGAAARVARSAPLMEFKDAVKLEVDSNFAKALPILTRPSVQESLVGDYAIYYQGLAELRLGRPADARRTFQTLAAKPPRGYLVEAAALREAECDEAMGDPAAAMQVYDKLAGTKTTVPDEVLLRLGRAAKAAGNIEKAVDALSRVLYEFPFSDLTAAASNELEGLPVPPIAAGTTRFKLELGRAERLFAAKRYTLARPVFESLRSAAQADERELVQLRLAECDYFLKRARAARDGVRPFIDKASRQGEALYFYAIATRELGDHAEYLRTVRRIVSEFPDQSWAEEALNNLATHYILQSDDELADQTFREMYEKYPTGHYAERAAWKVGWYAYKNGRYADTVRAFESAAANFPRSDYRPAWLYWSGRAHESLREPTVASERFALVAADYLNSYYGRLAAKRLDTSGAPRLVADAPPVDPPAEAPPLPPTAPLVRALLAMDLYDQALDELHYAQKTWGDSPAIQATVGYIYNHRGDLRAGINAMKRAYPQYLAAGGEKLPADLLKVLFPVNYWADIRRYAAAHDLDPYMMAALIAQESTFTADVKSAANAYGLMQLLPSTGRVYARKVGISRKFSLSLLTTADSNLRMGTAYFADLVRQFGGAHFALATYNAGPNRVQRWIAEKPGLERDEFIDDIPFPETQNYVKKILGTAEDYRRLYGPDGPSTGGEVDAQPAVARRAATPPVKNAAAARPSTPAAKAGTPRASGSKAAASKKQPAKKKSTRRTRQAA